MHATSGTSALSTVYWIQCPLCLLCLKWEIRERKPVPPQSPEFHWRYTLLSPLLTPEWGSLIAPDFCSSCRNRQLAFFIRPGSKAMLLCYQFAMNGILFKSSTEAADCSRYNQMILVLLLLLWHKSIWSPAVSLWSIYYIFHNHKKHLV